jgi:hypothetical protein
MLAFPSFQIRAAGTSRKRRIAMRNTHTSVGLALLALLLWCPIAAAQTDEDSPHVTPLAQLRVVEASSNTQGTASISSVDMGPFVEGALKAGAFTVCVPSGSCITAHATAAANQRSLLTTTEDALEIRGIMSATFDGFSGLAGASSRLMSTFAVDGVVPYILQADGVAYDGGWSLSVALEDAQGRRIEEISAPAAIAHTGRLPAGIYTLTAETRRGSLDVRFSAGGTAGPRPRCIIQMTAPSYQFGSVVTASQLRVENPDGAVPVELKMWLRLPDGREVQARNAGADGSVTIPAGGTQNFGPLAVMGVGSDIAPGLYEFGCRLLNPTTGRQLDEDSELFQIR